ncbi:MAG: hypothetical protein LBQ56_07665 [Synergistaceae bacterium]|jgi:hypothetical protein|nr:hypothetical protein [Synergistaceae bacterium]
MARFELISCRLAIQVCVGTLPNGRSSHRTFSVKNIDFDADAEAIADFVRAISPILAYPVTCVRLVRRYRVVTDETVNAPEAALSRRPSADPISNSTTFLMLSLLAILSGCASLLNMPGLVGGCFKRKRRGGLKKLVLCDKPAALTSLRV